MEVYQGKSVFGGIAIGRISVHKKDEQQVKRVRIEDSEQEILRYRQAKQTAMEQLQGLYQKALKEVGEANAAIFEIHQMMLEDDDQVVQVPLYILLVSKFQLTNSYISLILPGVCTSYNIFLAKQFFASIPTALIESAKLEGCNQFKIYRLIVLPLSKTILAVMAINTFLGSWNNFFWPFLVTSKDKMFTIQVGLKTFKFANGTLLSPMMAGACISAVPMFILFFSLQKYFLEGVTVGAVKG